MTRLIERRLNHETKHPDQYVKLFHLLDYESNGLGVHAQPSDSAALGPEQHQCEAVPADECSY